MNIKPQRCALSSLAKRLLQLSAALALSMPPVNMATAGTSIVATVTPHYGSFVNSLVASTGNLYWTSESTFRGDSPGKSYSYLDIWRASKQNTPGNEILLYREEAKVRDAFGSIVYAQVAGIWYGYFVANYYVPTSNGRDVIPTSYIKRVPLAGGPATIVTGTTFVDRRDLKTDGSYLYWADEAGIKRMPIEGGAIATLFATSTASWVGLDANFVYFNAGGSGASLYRVPKAGGEAAIQAIASGPVTDLYVHEAAPQTTLYWSAYDGSVQSYAVGSGATVTYQAPGENKYAKGVGFDGSRVLWRSCEGDAFCFLAWREAGTTFTVPTHFGILAFDGAQVFGAYGHEVWRYVHTPPPSVSLSPSSITAFRSGSGDITRVLSALTSNGETDYPGYRYSWHIDNDQFIPYEGASKAQVSLSAYVASCENQAGTLSVTVTDGIGRTATASADVSYTARKPPRGYCGD